MRFSVRRAPVLIASVATVLLSVVPLARPAAASGTGSGAPTVTGNACVGNTDTLSWTAPVAGVTGYWVQETYSTGDETAQRNVYVPGTQTSVTYPVELGGTAFILYYETASSGYAMFATANGPGYQTPLPLLWDNLHYAAGDGTATVTFYWSQHYVLEAGDINTVQVTVTASPGGASITSAPYVVNQVDFGVTDTFNGLTDGVQYTFTAYATDECGTGPSNGSNYLTPEAPGALSCAVTSVQYPPAVPEAQESVTVQSMYGLEAVFGVQIVNGTVTVAPFTQGTTAPVVVTAAKSNPYQSTVWSFYIADAFNRVVYCD